MSRRIIFASILGIGGILLALFVSTRTQPNGATPATEQPAGVSATSTLSLTPLDWTATTSTTTTNALLETEVLTRNVLGPYLMQTSQGTYSATTANAIIENATKEVTKLVYTPLTSEVLTTTENTSPARALQYKNELHTALQPVFALEEYELTIYARATERNSKADFDKLTEYAQVYRTAADAVRKVPVPKDASAIQLNIINSMYHFAVMLEALSAGFDDPARSISGISNFNTVEAEFTQSFANLRTYFVLKDIAE